MPGVGLITWAIDYRVDRARKDVTVTLLGLGRSHAVYRAKVSAAISITAVPLPTSRCRRPMANRRRRCCLTSPGLRSSRRKRRNWPPRSIALLPSRSKPPSRRTRAIVVLKDGRVVAERYAEGIGIDTPHARLLRHQVGDVGAGRHSGAQGRADAAIEPVPIAAWQGADDPRRAITLDHLLRHTAGLTLGSSLQASLGSALEPVNRMKFMEIRYGGLCREHAAGDAARQRVELS